MRYLNKIIFINSASISYADISIDGNVHFVEPRVWVKAQSSAQYCFFTMQINLNWGSKKASALLMNITFLMETPTSYMK